MNMAARRKEGVLCTSMFIFCILASLSSGCGGTAFSRTNGHLPSIPANRHEY